MIERDILGVAFSSAVKANPMFCPTAEQVRVAGVEFRAKISKERESMQRNDRLLDDSDDSKEADITPDNPAYELAMKWRRESKELSGHIPREIAKLRFEELAEMVVGL